MPSQPPPPRVLAHDLLAAIACSGLATVALRFLAAHPRGFMQPREVGLAMLFWMLVLPAAVGAAVGCLASGWRRCWRLLLVSVVAWLLLIWLLTSGVMRQ
ncbi:MAG: hypothetical protein U0836_22140 [Pirellulales bacterium]